ncbi:MAG: hypothetical protein ACPG5B_03885 [Chitinophagales bacterium]
MLQLQKLDIQNFSAENWNKSIDFRKRFFRQTFPNEPEPNFDTWQATMERYHANNSTYTFYNILLNEKVIAQIWHFITDIEKATEKQYIRIHHDMNFESEALFDLISEKIANWKTQGKLSILTTQTDFAYKIAEKNGFTKGNEKTFLFLQTKKFKQKQLQEWATFLPNSFSYSIIEKPNQKECGEIAEIMTFLLNDMKRSDRSQTFHLKAEDVAKRYEQSLLLGITYRHILLRNEKAELIGMSFLSYDRKNAQSSRQFMTGTLPAYRRKGLAKFMKATMYLFLQKEEPTIQLVKTDCFTENDRMLNLNIQMGFEIEFLEQEWFFKYQALS